MIDLTKPMHVTLVFACVVISSRDSFAEPPKIRFDRDIRPILSDNCFKCHGPDKRQREAELRLDLKDQALADREGKAAVWPGNLKKSLMWQRIVSDDADERMPPADSNKSLTDQQINLIRTWIEQGAGWNEHWAFKAPLRPKLPAVSDARWGRNAIDRFVLARLDRERLKPSPEADRRTLARRLSFDLIGLPPSPAGVESFVNDKSPKAYERFVDKLLASPHFGERMAVMWLDAARYGDTSVFHADGSRDMWPWRDWIIEAYNENKSFKQFSIEQLAGDLLKDATRQQRIATGFNRNNATTDEGGSIVEEFRVEYAIDRVRTTSMTWLGLSLECAQCHDHKYDPFTQKEYYQFFAYFNQASDPGIQTRNGNQTPVADHFDKSRLARADQLKKALSELEKKLGQRAAEAEGPFSVWLHKASADPTKLSIDPLPQDPVVHLPLDEKDGDKVADVSQNGRAGSVKGKAVWADGKTGGALQTDRNNYADLGLVADFERFDEFSYGCWIRPAGVCSGAPLGRMDEAKNNRGFFLDSSGGNLQIMISHTWPLNSIMVVDGEKLKPGQWQHVFVTYDGSSTAAGVRVYVDGKPRNLTVVADCLSRTIRSSAPLLIGRRYNGDHGSPFVGSIDDVRIYARKLSSADVEALAGQDPITPLLALEMRSDEQIEVLRRYFLNHHESTYRDLAAKLRDQKQEIASLTRPVSTAMIMQDVDAPRDTFILRRGSYAQPTDTKVFPKTPAILPPLPDGAPRNRLSMARWLFQDDHPLTARVAVNRYWQMLFGVGLVSTPEDFGSQGEYPSHGELLDWLAVDFRENGWDIKRSLKQIVTSATYRQSSNVSPALAARDPRNRLLARGPRFRLQGEFIRDAALAVSGRLVKDMGGPGVRPYQPAGLWAEVGLGAAPKFVQDHKDALYRRSVYTYWKRSAPPPSMHIFDAPTRERCTLRRPRTNTPLQALVMLNDVQFVEAARNLAERLLKRGDGTADERFDRLYLLVLSRPPRDSERAVLHDVLRAAMKRFGDDPKAAQKLLEVGESKRDPSLDAVEYAAWTVLSNMILNLDEALSRG